MRKVLAQCVAALFVVNTTDDHDDGVADTQDTTVREAIHAANNHPGHDTILFNIPGTGVRTIRPLINLPATTDPVTIDGYSQPGARPNTLAVGFDGVLLIEISSRDNVGGAGSNISTGLNIAGGDSIVRGLVINRVGTGLFVRGEGNNNLIEGNIIGLDPTGNVSLAGSLVLVSSSNNTIALFTTKN